MDPYSILGISPSASDEEVKEAYRALTRKYHPDNYADDNPLKDLANEKMQQINEAYDRIQRERAARASSTGGTGYQDSYTGSGSGACADIRRALNARRFGEAERLLFAVPDAERGAEWHYLASVILMKRGRVNDAMRELEMACEMDPGNMEYQKAKEMFNTSARGYGSTYYGDDRTVRTQDGCCDVCANLLVLDCLCECCGGDLIPCC